MNTGLQFAHVRNCAEGRSYTLAYTIAESSNPLFPDAYEVIVGIAICAPGDQYEKAKGRLIATGRYDKRPWTGYFTSNDRHEILSILRAELLEEGEEPESGHAH